MKTIEFPKLKLQVFIKLHYKEVIAVLVVLVVLLLAYILRLANKPIVIVPPTQQEYEEASKIRKQDCSCWDETVGVCLPNKVCQIREQEVR
jgi:hypothetical protein